MFDGGGCWLSRPLSRLFTGEQVSSLSDRDGEKANPQELMT